MPRKLLHIVLECPPWRSNAIGEQLPAEKAALNVQ